MMLLLPSCKNRHPKYQSDAALPLEDQATGWSLVSQVLALPHEIDPRNTWSDSSLNARAAMPQEYLKQMLPSQQGECYAYAAVEVRGVKLPIVYVVREPMREVEYFALVPFWGQPPTPISIAALRQSEQCRDIAYGKIDTAGHIQRHGYLTDLPGKRLLGETFQTWDFNGGTWQPNRAPAATHLCGLYQDTTGADPDGALTLLRLSMDKPSPGQWVVAVERCRQEDNGEISQCEWIGNAVRSPSAAHTDAYFASGFEGEYVAQFWSEKTPAGALQIYVEPVGHARRDLPVQVYERIQTCR